MNTRSKKESKEESKQQANKKTKSPQKKAVLEALKEQDVNLMSDEDLRAKITKITSYISKMDMLLNRTEKMLEKELEGDLKEKKLVDHGMELLNLTKGGKQI